jgi:hypothetical protein
MNLNYIQNIIVVISILFLLSSYLFKSPYSKKNNKKYITYKKSSKSSKSSKLSKTSKSSNINEKFETVSAVKYPNLNICKYIKKTSYKYDLFEFLPISDLSSSWFSNYYVGKVRNVDEAVEIANTYAATIFVISPENYYYKDLYIGFGYNRNKRVPEFTKNNLDPDSDGIANMRVYIPVPPSKDVNGNIIPLVSGTNYIYDKTFADKYNTGFSDMVDMGAYFLFKIGKIEGGYIDPNTEKYIENKTSQLDWKKSNLALATKLANSIGATAFYINNSGDIYGTYNFPYDLYNILMAGNYAIDMSLDVNKTVKNKIYYTSFRFEIDQKRSLYCLPNTTPAPAPK